MYAIQLRHLSFLGLLFITHFVIAQGETDNWYFGFNAGIQFKSDSINIHSNGKINGKTSRAVISTVNGRLLFYTDGLNIWDSTHSVMPNGYGLRDVPQNPPTQSSLIVPLPDKSGLYIVFTLDRYNKVDYSKEVYYSIVDMKLNSGKGDIITGKKKLVLLSSTCEKITAIKHTNNKDYWVVAHKYASDSIYSYLISSLGISPNPVISKTRVKIITFGNFVEGHMKISPDGRKIAYANYAFDSAAIGDFDASTGKISNVWSFYYKQSWGVEFSPKSNYVYIGQNQNPIKQNCRVIQYYAKAANKAAFITSQINIDTGFKNVVGALQLGKNGKIYITEVNCPYLHVINAPDSAGLNCRLQRNGLYLGGNLTSVGLPNFIQSYFKPEPFKIIKRCIRDTAFFYIPANQTCDSAHWDFGDTSSGINNTSKNIKDVFHVYNNYGIYTITLILYSNLRMDTLKSIIVFNNPKIDFLGADVCEKDSVRFINKSTKAANLSYRWKFGDGNSSNLESPNHLYQIGGVTQTFNVSLSGTMVDGCSDSITRPVTVNAIPISDFSYIINGSKVELKAAQSSNISYRWRFGKTDSATTTTVTYSQTITNPDQYLVCLKAMNLAGCLSETCKNISVGISSLIKPDAIRIFPNPNRGSFILYIQNPESELSIDIFNMLGEKIKSVVAYPNKFYYNINLEVSDGIYSLRGKNSGVFFNKKIVISN